MIENFHQRVFEQWLEMAVLSGAINLPLYETDPDRYRNVRWMPRGWSWVDPQKEVEAYKAAELAGYVTKSEIIAENGGDIEEVFNQRRRELDMAQDLDLTFDTSDPAAIKPPAPAPAVQPDPTQQDAAA
jgi:capsid protein